MSNSRSHPTGNDESLLPSNWGELAPLVDAVLDAPPERRAAIFDELSAGDPHRRATLERLVAECERDMPLLNRPAAERFDHLLGSASEAAEVPLPEMLGGRYRIERELGRGGMARVYLAHDAKHTRDVAVKVIRPEFAASMGRERFLREIAIAARLRHPNIVPLYDSGDADGVLYFVMPYEAGPSLRARLSRGESVPVSECVSILRDVARALAYAHEQGVVHRDVKPDNVMLCGGAAVVTDFGIAKAVSVAQDGVSEATLTQVGAGIGTPAYMAPEQATGDPSTDHRADIYSFGCLAYELFTGKPPFHGLPSHQIIAAHVGTKPVPITEGSADVPDAIARLITRCLEKQPAARPQSAQELLTELESGSTTPHEPVRHRRRLPTPVLISLVVIGVMVVGGAGYLVSRLRGAPAVDELTVAVLPLTSVGGDSVQRELADGLSDEVATALFRVPGVRVMSRGGAGNYGGQRKFDPAKIGRELGARFLVMGSLREVDGRLRVLASLVDTPNGAMQWSEQFDRDQRDLGTVRDEIARGVGETLQRILGSRVGATSAQKAARTGNPDAYRLYVLAQRALDRRGQSIQASIDNFRRASELDTLYADAISGLSFALALSPYFQNVSTRDVEAEATTTARRALRLDSTLAQPYVALGLVHQHAWDWARAETEYRTAIRLDSRNVEARVQFGRHLLFRGRIAEGLEQFLSARDDDPASALVLSWVSYAYYLEGELDSAIVYSEHAYQSDSTNMTTLGHGALIRLKAGRTAEARKFVSRLGPMGGNVLYILAATGDAASVMSRLRRPDGPRLSWNIRFMAMLGVGDTTQALAALERATDEHENWPSVLAMSDPVFDPIRASARFQALLRRVGLPASETPVVFRPSSR